MYTGSQYFIHAMIIDIQSGESITDIYADFIPQNADNPNFTEGEAVVPHFYPTEWRDSTRFKLEILGRGFSKKSVDGIHVDFPRVVDENHYKYKDWYGNWQIVEYEGNIRQILKELKEKSETIIVNALVTSTEQPGYEE